MPKGLMNFEPFFESEYGRSLIIDFAKMSQLDEELFRDRVNKNRGTIFVFIHPYYHGDLENNSVTQKMNRKVEEMISSYEGMPVIFMEEESEIAILRDRLGEIAQKRVYIVPTFDNSSYSKFTNSKNGEWDVFSRKLHGLGVRKIILGGVNFEVDVLPGQERRADLQLFSCVGSAAKQFMTAGFGIEISDATFPHGKKDFEAEKKRMEGVMKEDLERRNTEDYLGS